MPKRIILVRHGQTDFNKGGVLQGRLDTFLNATGLAQAEKAAEKLAKEKIDVLYSSDLKRTFQTAQTIAEKLKMKIHKAPLLRERAYGGLEGLSFEEVKKNYPYLPFSWDRGFLDSVSRHFKVETDGEMAKRFNTFFNLLKCKHKDQSVLLVVHGGVLWTVFSYFNLIGEIEERGKQIFANAGICILEKKGEKYSLVI